MNTIFSSASEQTIELLSRLLRPLAIAPFPYLSRDEIWMMFISSSPYGSFESQGLPGQCLARYPLGADGTLWHGPKFADSATATLVVPHAASTVADVAPKPYEKRSNPQSPHCVRIGSPRRPYPFSKSMSSILLAVPLQISDSSRYLPPEPARSVASITPRYVYYIRRKQQPSCPPSRWHNAPPQHM